MQLRPGTTGRIQFKVVVILVILITMIYDPHRGVILLSPHDHLYHRDSWSFSSSSSSRSWWLMIILISSQSKMTKAGSKGQGLPSGPLLPHGLVLVKNLSTFNLVQQHMDIAPKTWSWSNLSLSTGRWGVQGITWHSWARRSWKASSQWHLLSADGSHHFDQSQFHPHHLLWPTRSSQAENKSSCNWIWKLCGEKPSPFLEVKSFSLIENKFSL